MGSIIVPPGGQVKIQLHADRLPIAVECAIHAWMRGWIRVFDHPYYAVTDENGAFEIKNAPAGNYRLMVWHGSAGWKGAEKGRNGDPVEIKGGAVVDLGNLVLPRRRTSSRRQNELDRRSRKRRACVLGGESQASRLWLTKCDRDSNAMLEAC